MNNNLQMYKNLFKYGPDANIQTVFKNRINPNNIINDNIKNYIDTLIMQNDTNNYYTTDSNTSNNTSNNTNGNYNSNNIIDIDTDSNTLDTFNRLRTSSANTIIEYNNVYQKNTLKVVEYTTGDSTISYNDSMVTMECNGVGRAVRQSRKYASYHPGKALLIYMTGILNNNNDNTVTTCIGYYDDMNGLFFKHNGTNYSIVERKNGNDVEVLQKDWNIDTMDGKGPSRITIDFTKYLIYCINFSWLGAGIAKFGIFYAGKYYNIHEFRHKNITTPYIVTPNLPTRYEIISTGGNGSIVESCVVVMSEGENTTLGQQFTIGTNNSKTIDYTETYIMSIRLKQDFRKLVKLKSITLFCNTRGDNEYKVYYIPSPTSIPISDSNFRAVNNHYGCVEYDIDGSTVNTSTSIELTRGYISTLTNVININFDKHMDSIYLTAGVESGENFKSDYIYITGKKIIGNNEALYATISWIEL